MELRLTATSGLLAGSRGWRGLAAAHNLDFGEYGDWARVLTAPDEARALVWVVLLDRHWSPGRRRIRGPC